MSIPLTIKLPDGWSIELDQAGGRAVLRHFGSVCGEGWWEGGDFVRTVYRRTGKRDTARPPWDEFAEAVRRAL